MDRVNDQVHVFWHDNVSPELELKKLPGCIKSLQEYFGNSRMQQDRSPPVSRKGQGVGMARRVPSHSRLSALHDDSILSPVCVGLVTDARTSSLTIGTEAGQDNKHW